MEDRLINSKIYGINYYPKNWKLGRFKNLCKIFSGGTPDTNNILYWDGNIPWIQSGKLQYNDIYDESGFITELGLNHSSTKMIRKDTPLLAMTGATCGNVGFLRINACANQSVMAFETNNYSDSRFIYYSLINSKAQILLLQSGGAQSGISTQNGMNLKLVFPEFKEQKKIAEYLDKKCSKIDGIIKDNNKEIELLEEYKMKVLDSSCLKGIEQHDFINVNHYSINKIPTGWKFKKTLSVLKMPITDGPHLTPNLIDDGIPFISADAIKDGKIDFSRKRGDISENDYIEFSRKYVPKLNDIYMIKSGATTGKVGIVETKEKFTIWSPLAVYRADEKEINFKYLYYLLQTNFYQKQVQLNWSFGTQQNIGMRTLEKLKVLVPPLEEQEKIVNYIDDRINKLNQIINYRKQIIEKLEEYKKSLIYECVTGKREV